MIDTPTAWAILSTPLGIAAGLGWMREAKRSLKWHDRAWRAINGWKEATRINQGLVDRLVDTEDRLRRIERQRSESTRKGNITRSAQRKALQASTTASLERAVAAKTDRAAA